MRSGVNPVRGKTHITTTDSLNANLASNGAKHLKSHSPAFGFWLFYVQNPKKPRRCLFGNLFHQIFFAPKDKFESPATSVVFSKAAYSPPAYTQLGNPVSKSDSSPPQNAKPCLFLQQYRFHPTFLNNCVQ